MSIKYFSFMKDKCKVICVNNSTDIENSEETQKRDIRDI